MYASQLSRNSAFAVGQALVVTACLFAAYRILLHYVGIERMGLWSLLLAGSIIARLADSSGAGALARFVAEQRRIGANASAGDYIHTVTLTALAFNATAGIILYAGSDYLINRFIESKFVPEALSLAPLAIFSQVIFAPIATALASAVDGLQRTDIRALIVSSSSTALLVVTALSVPRIGIFGFALAQLVQQSVVLVACWIVLRSHIPNLGMLPYRWSTPIARETVVFGLKLQLIALVNLLSEPLAKGMLSHWGGLAAVGYYELASRLVTQVRGLTVQAMTPLMPAVAGADQQALKSLMRRVTTPTIIAAIGQCCVCILVAPLVSFFLLGTFQQHLVFPLMALALGHSINTLSVPYFFVGSGRGIMKWNICSQFVMAGCIVLIGSLLGPKFGLNGIVIAIVGGLCLGSIVVAIGNRRDIGLNGDFKYFAASNIGAATVMVMLVSLGWHVNDWLFQ